MLSLALSSPTSGFVLEARTFTSRAPSKSHGQGPESSVRSRSRPWNAPSIAARTVSHGSGLPAFTDKASAIAKAVVVSPVQASERFEARTSVAGMGAGGACNRASSLRRPAGISSDNRLVGPCVSQSLPSLTAQPIASSTTACGALGIVTGSS